MNLKTIRISKVKNWCDEYNGKYFIEFKASPKNRRWNYVGERGMTKVYDTESEALNYAKTTFPHHQF